MEKIIISSGLSFIITFFAIPIIIQVAKEKKLFDEPNHRKIHKTVIPTLGGLGIYAGFIIATLMFVPFQNTVHFQYYLAASLVIFFLGLKDDILILSASKKFIGQLIAAWILFQFGGIQINNMQGLFGLDFIPSAASTVLSLFTIVVITNSFNLIDGVDGLAGSLGLLTTFLFGCYFFYIGETALAVMAFTLFGSLISFLIYNFPPAKIFMGDTGSLLVGLMNSVFVIKFINTSQINAADFVVPSAPAIGFAVLLVPLFDTLRVFTIRIFSRRSPFSPDRNHIHHLILDLGFSHKQTTLICLSANIVFITLAILLRNAGINLLMSVLFIMPLALTFWLYYQKNKRQKSESHKSVNQQDLVPSQKLFSLVHETVDVD